MESGKIERNLVFYFRFLMAWTFLYAASHQLFDPKFSAAGFLEHTKTFHDFFVLFTVPAMLPLTNFMVEWGHFLIGLSLLFGLFVRVSSAAGILLMITYYFAHMDFPFIESNVNFLVDYHLVYAGVLGLLMVKEAGHVWGLDGIVSRLDFFRTHPRLGALV